MAIHNNERTVKESVIKGKRFMSVFVSLGLEGAYKNINSRITYHSADGNFQFSSFC
jgi:hypothetical protein